MLAKLSVNMCRISNGNFYFPRLHSRYTISFDNKTLTRIASALLGLRQALKISIYDSLPIFHQITVDLFLNGYNAFVFIAVSNKFDFGPCPLNTRLKV